MQKSGRLIKRIGSVFTLGVIVSVMFVVGKKQREIEVSIEKIGHSVINDNGEVIATIYYDKPILSGDNVICQAINGYFDEECQDWFNSKSRLAFFQEDRMDDFLNDVEEMREAMGDEVLAQHPFTYVVDTEVKVLNGEFLSVIQTVKCQTTGPESKYYLGSTFDMQTGELIPLDAIVETDADSLRDKIVKMLSEKTDFFYNPEHLEHVIEIYDKREDASYLLNNIENEVFLNYEYFYDGEYIYIILNYDIYPNEGCVVKWDGKSEGELEVYQVLSSALYDSFCQSVPELQKYSDYIIEQSTGEADLVIEVYETPKQITCRNGSKLGIGFISQWIPRRCFGTT